jgi:PilZ domain-containing protein
MTQNRRTNERKSLNLDARWDSLSGQHEARISDIGLGGCFVNTVTRVELGEVIGIEMRRPSGEWLRLQGAVSSCHEGVGFGLEFTALTKDQKSALQGLIA